jgi:glucokinase
VTAHLAAGDIGGTNTELAICEITTADRREVREAFPSVFRQPNPILSAMHFQFGPTERTEEGHDPDQALV